LHKLVDEFLATEETKKEMNKLRIPRFQGWYDPIQTGYRYGMPVEDATVTVSTFNREAKQRFIGVFKNVSFYIVFEECVDEIFLCHFHAGMWQKNNNEVYKDLIVD